MISWKVRLFKGPSQIKRLNKHLFSAKFILVLCAGIFLFNTAQGRSVDTAYVFFKYVNNGYQKVDLKEYCDFYRMITSPDPGDDKYNIKDFYKNGKIKSTGKASAELVNKSGQLALDGDFTSYFENGNKQSVIHYQDGYEIGDEYRFYPDGKIYALFKNTLIHGYLSGKTKNWDCYDKKGSRICKAGNGEWVFYDNNFENISIEGPLKNEERNGEWHGTSTSPDTVTYTIKYKNDHFVSGTGFDKTGKAYPYTDEIDPAHYWSGPFNFLRSLQTHLDLPKDANGKKIPVDDVIISFVIEKDGSISNFETVTIVEPDVREAIGAALAKCKNWIPRKVFGIPKRAKVTFSMNYRTTTDSRSFIDQIYHGEMQIPDDKVQ